MDDVRGVCVEDEEGGSWGGEEGVREGQEEEGGGGWAELEYDAGTGSGAGPGRKDGDGSTTSRTNSDLSPADRTSQNSDTSSPDTFATAPHSPLNSFSNLPRQTHSTAFTPLPSSLRLPLSGYNPTTLLRPVEETQAYETAFWSRTAARGETAGEGRGRRACGGIAGFLGRDVSGDVREAAVLRCWKGRMSMRVDRKSVV